MYIIKWPPAILSLNIKIVFLQYSYRPIYIIIISDIHYPILLGGPYYERK